MAAGMESGAHVAADMDNALATHLLIGPFQSQGHFLQPNFELIIKLGPIFNPFNRIAILVQKIYYNFQPIYHNIKSNRISHIYIEKHIKIASYMLSSCIKSNTLETKIAKVPIFASNFPCLRITCSLFRFILTWKSTLPNINQKAIFVMENTETSRFF